MKYLKNQSVAHHFIFKKDKLATYLLPFRITRLPFIIIVYYLIAYKLNSLIKLEK